MKPIRLSGHARLQLRFRGVTEDEIREAIENSSWSNAEIGRLECRRDFAFGQDWNGKVYAFKQVRPIFVEELTEIVVITGYAYYF